METAKEKEDYEFLKHKVEKELLPALELVQQRMKVQEDLLKPKLIKECQICEISAKKKKVTLTQSGHVLIQFVTPEEAQLFYDSLK